MKLSTRARYAMHLMLEVAKNPRATTSLGEVAQRTQISRRYLDQLVISLRNAGLIRGRSGRGGGYRITCDPDDIAVGQIIEAVIGPINIVECVRRPETCLKADTCECRIVHCLINQRIVELLYSVSLADMSDKKWLKCALRDLGGNGGVACARKPTTSEMRGVTHVR